MLFYLIIKEKKSYAQAQKGDEDKYYTVGFLTNRNPRLSPKPRSTCPLRKTVFSTNF